MTIKELMTELSKFNPLDIVVITDADTGWFLNIEEVKRKDNHHITIEGDYNNKTDLDEEI